MISGVGAVRPGQRARLLRLRFHDLGRNCTTLLHPRNFGPEKALEMLGHTYFSETMDTCTHVLPSTQGTGQDGRGFGRSCCVTVRRSYNSLTARMVDTIVG